MQLLGLSSAALTEDGAQQLSQASGPRDTSRVGLEGAALGYLSASKLLTDRCFPLPLYPPMSLFISAPTHPP